MSAGIIVSNDTFMRAVKCLDPSAEIERILADMQRAIDSGKFIPICRRKNLETLAILGLGWKDVKEEIYGLTTENYVSGPDLDRDNPSSDCFWKFKKRVGGEIIYIKFKLMYQENGGVKLVSFHLDE